MADLLSRLLDLYVIAIFGRILLSYFPITPGSAMASIFSFLYRITEPVLAPARRIIPPLGMFDLSPIVVIFAIRIIGGILVNAMA